MAGSAPVTGAEDEPSQVLACVVELEVGEDAMTRADHNVSEGGPCRSCRTRRGSRPSLPRGAGGEVGAQERAGCPRSAPGNRPSPTRQRRRPTTCLGGAPSSLGAAGDHPLRSGATTGELGGEQPGLEEPKLLPCSAEIPLECVAIIGGPEPRDQRQLGAVHHRTGRHRGLLATVGDSWVYALVASAHPRLLPQAGQTKPAGQRKMARRRRLLRLENLVGTPTGNGGSRSFLGIPRVMMFTMFYHDPRPTSPHFVVPDAQG